MTIFRRVTVLALFAALGVGIAFGVGLRAGRPAVENESHQPAHDATPEHGNRALEAIATSGQGKAVCPVLPLPPPPGPVRVEPHPPRGAQASQGGATPDFSALLDVMSELKQRLAPQQEPTPVAAQAPSMPIPPAPTQGENPAKKQKISRSAGSQGDQGLSINIQNTDVREVLDLLSQQGNLNILASPNVQGKVSATLNDVGLDQALDAILKATGFRARREDKFVFVGTAADFEAMEQNSDTIGTRVYRPNYVKAVDLQKLIQPLLTPQVGAVSVSSDTKSGIGTDMTQAGGNDYAGGDALLVRDYEAVLAEVDQLVEEIDIRPMQVHIEAMILSVKLNDVDSFGVDFEMLGNDPNLKIGWGTIPDKWADFKIDGKGLKIGLLSSSVGTFVNALETIGDTNVISTPRLMVLNKHRAEIQIGEQKGYVSSTFTETSTAQSVEFLELGTILRIRPFISTDGLIRMEVHPEISDGTVKVEGEFTLPNKQLTQVTTNIMVRDGCTVIIGGLIKDQQETTTTQIPWLGNLPWVGAAFRTKKETLTRHEIIVLLTPRIVHEPGTCEEGQKAACEFHRRQATYADKMSPIGKRSLGRRYMRLAQEAWAAGDRQRAMRNAELAVQFDPLNAAAIDLRSDIWQGNRYGDHTLDKPPVEPLPAEAMDEVTLAPWLLEGLSSDSDSGAAAAHPYDPGQPGRHRDLERPRRLQ